MVINLDTQLSHNILGYLSELNPFNNTKCSTIEKEHVRDLPPLTTMSIMHINRIVYYEYYRERVKRMNIVHNECYKEFELLKMFYKGS